MTTVIPDRRRSGLIRNLASHFLTVVDERAGDGADGLIVYGGGGQQRAMYRDARQVFGGHGRISEISSGGDYGGCESRVCDLHRCGVLDRYQPGLAVLYQLLDRRITESAHAKDRIGFSVEKSTVRIRVVAAHKLKVRLTQAVYCVTSPAFAAIVAAVSLDRMV